MLSLTVLRMDPVALGLVGSHLRGETVLFIGWFGPRGVASTVFALLGFEAMADSNLPVETVGATFAWAILLSVVLNGLSAGPVAAWYGRRIASLSPPLSGSALRSVSRVTSESAGRLGHARRKRAGMAGCPPAIDFKREVAIWFGAVYGASSPLMPGFRIWVGGMAPLA